MYEIRVHFDNGDHIDTRINGSIDTIVNYYLNQKFPFLSESGREYMSVARCVEFFPPVPVKFRGIDCHLMKVYSLSPKMMARYHLVYPFRAVLMEVHHTFVCTMKWKNHFAYVPDMFG